MRIPQHVLIFARPLCGGRQRIPIGGAEEGGCDVHLLQLRSASEVRPHLTAEIPAWIGFQIVQPILPQSRPCSMSELRGNSGPACTMFL